MAYHPSSDQIAETTRMAIELTGREDFNKGLLDDIGGAIGGIGRGITGAARAAAAVALLPAVTNLYYHYKGALLVQGGGIAIPPDVLEIIKPYYDIPWGEVRCHQVNTFIPDTAITLENDIFFPAAVNFHDYSDLHLLLHELEHVRQFKVRTLPGFLALYVNQVLESGESVDVGRGSLNFHDAIGLEREAEGKADRIIGEVWDKLTKKVAASRKAEPRAGADGSGESARGGGSGTSTREGGTLPTAEGVPDFSDVGDLRPFLSAEMRDATRRALGSHAAASGSSAPEPGDGAAPGSKK